MATKKKANGHSNGSGLRKIGVETRTLKQALSDEAIETETSKLAKTYERQKKVQTAFTAMRKDLEPRIERAFDPKRDADDPAPRLSVEEARGMSDHLELERRRKSTTIAMLKAERNGHVNAIANRYRYELVECDMLADDENLTVKFVAPDGTLVDERGMTGDEKQVALHGTEIPESTSGAPASVQ